MGTKQIRVGELNFSVVDEGSGAAVLLLHGFPDSSDLWRNQIPALVDAGLRVIVPDLRGFGESDKPPGGRSLCATTHSAVAEKNGGQGRD